MRNLRRRLQAFLAPSKPFLGTRSSFALLPRCASVARGPSRQWVSGSRQCNCASFRLARPGDLPEAHAGARRGLHVGEGPGRQRLFTNSRLAPNVGQKEACPPESGACGNMVGHFRDGGASSH